MLLLNSPRPGIGSGCDCWSRRSTWLGAPARLRSRRWRKTRWASERWRLTTQEEENGDVKLTNDDKRNTIYKLTNTEITFIHVKITASSFTFSACHISLHLWIQLSFLPLHKCFPEATYRSELSALERIHCSPDIWLNTLIAAQWLCISTTVNSCFPLQRDDSSRCSGVKRNWLASFSWCVWQTVSDHTVPKIDISKDPHAGEEEARSC